MKEIYEIKPIAHIKSDFKQKYGIPRQPRLVEGLLAEVVMNKEFNNMDAMRGLEEFSHIWLLWGFSKNTLDMKVEPVKWNPLVRPPRLGGEIKKGVFATRSPYRPNSLGMSAVELKEIVCAKGDIKLVVAGADLLDGTPIFDIKPYIPFSDAIPDASSGFVSGVSIMENTQDNTENIINTGDNSLKVVFPQEFLKLVNQEKREPLINILRMDPRDAYDKKHSRICKLAFANVDVTFEVLDDILKVLGVKEL